MDGPVTKLLRQWSEGDSAALDELMPVVYEELHRLAGRYLRGERPGHTLRPTDLVSEAFLRFAGAEPLDWNDRVHFFAIAARTMRKILVDHARRGSAAKRGGRATPSTLVDTIPGAERPRELVALDDALIDLAGFDERKAQVVELHYFGGLTHDEIAQHLHVHSNTVARELRLAEAFLQRALSESR